MEDFVIFGVRHHKLEAVEYGQIMESVKMKVSDRKKRGKTGNVQFETLRRNQMAIGCERERIVHQPKRGFVRAVPKRESPSRTDLRLGLNPEQRCLFNVHALTSGGQKKGFLNGEGRQL